jgi:hypothetical protein
LSGPYLLLGQRPASDASPSDTPRSTLRSWILFADADGFSAQLSDQLTKKLQARGDLVIEARASEGADRSAAPRDHGQLRRTRRHRPPRRHLAEPDGALADAAERFSSINLPAARQPRTSSRPVQARKPKPPAG